MKETRESSQSKFQPNTADWKKIVAKYEKPSTPKAAWQGFHAAVEIVHTGRLAVNDINDDAAPAATVLNLRAGLSQSIGAWRLDELLRIDNATDRRYAGSVIVNDANKRYFEPALPRTAMLMLTGQYQWR